MSQQEQARRQGGAGARHGAGEAAGSGTVSGRSTPEKDGDRAREDERTLTGADVDAIAQRVLELVERDVGRLGHVGTRGLAKRLGVSEDWVRAHASELGAVRLGDGARGVLRFDLERVRDVLEARRVGLRPGSERQRARPRARKSAIALLPLPPEAR